MSDHSPSFIDDCLVGRAQPRDIDVYVERWHFRTDDGADLGAYLGMSDSEYERWMRDPDAIADIIAARRRNVHAAE